MERRAQMVINTCTALGEHTPIAMIHDVGAGGLSNALPECKQSHDQFYIRFLMLTCFSGQGCRIWRQI